MARSKRKSAKAAAKKSAAAQKAAEATPPGAAVPNGEGADDAASNGKLEENSVLDELAASVQVAEAAGRVETRAQAQKRGLRSTTGVLASHPLSRDLKIEQLNIMMSGVPLVEDQQLDLNYGRRYGILGVNGCGKSTILEVIANNELPIPDHFNFFHLSKETPPLEKTPVEVILEEVRAEAKRLEAEAEYLLQKEGADCEAVTEIYDRLDEMDIDQAESKVCQILAGLGFTDRMIKQHTKDFSGGWRMRVALAQALYIKPMLLLLDEPTNHLDLEACVWLENYLSGYDRILLLISHSQDFLNNVCTNIIHMKDRRIIAYTGNYDQFVKTRSELEEQQMKTYNWEQDQIAKMKEYIARFGHGSAKLARQAQSKEKTLQKMYDAGLTEKVTSDKTLKLHFEECGKLTPPVMMFNHVAFAYNDDDAEKRHVIYEDVDFGIDLDTRLALVGPNGAGKSTLLKLMTDNLTPTSGMIRRHHHLKIAFFHQHLAEEIDETQTPLEFVIDKFQLQNNMERARGMVGRFGLTGKAQTTPIALLSEGQKRRVAFAWVAHQKPHLLILDEPTNHLDMETIDSLADAINAWDGGLVLVSHDFRLINQVAKEIWVCDHKKIEKWPGSIQSYKEHLRQEQGL
jgi:ATP-binding cassette, subfamily F, member 2